MKATVLGNNLTKEERNQLRGEALSAQIAVRNAQTYGETVTAEMIELEGLGQIVLTKLTAATRRKNRPTIK